MHSRHLRLVAISVGSFINGSVIFSTITLGSPTTFIPDRMTHAADMLRYAAAVAYEHADNLKGSERDMAFSVLHFIEIAREDVNNSLTGLES